MLVAVVIEQNDQNVNRSKFGCIMQMQGEDMDVMVAAYLAFREFDERRDMLMFGDPWFNQDVTG